MSLRGRQIGGIPLSYGDAWVLTFIFALCIPILAYGVWFRIFSAYIPFGARAWLVACSEFMYFTQCIKIVPLGLERAQLFLGKYTGVSFSSGICALPKLPFPIVYALLWVFDKVSGGNIGRYFGWILEGDASLESIVVPFISEGRTIDGARVLLKGSLVLEVSNVAVYLLQKGNDSNHTSIKEAIKAETSSRIKQYLIARHTVNDLMQGKYDGGLSLTRQITESCSFVNDFGLRLSRSPITDVEMLSKPIEHAFDLDGSQVLLDKQTMALMRRFLVFKEGLGPNMSAYEALGLFNQNQASNGSPTLTPNILKLI